MPITPISDDNHMGEIAASMRVYAMRFLPQERTVVDLSISEMRGLAAQAILAHSKLSQPDASSRETGWSARSFPGKHGRNWFVGQTGNLDTEHDATVMITGGWLHETNAQALAEWLASAYNAAVAKPSDTKPFAFMYQREGHDPDFYLYRQWQYFDPKLGYVETPLYLGMHSPDRTYTPPPPPSLADRMFALIDRARAQIVDADTLVSITEQALALRGEYEDHEAQRKAAIAPMSEEDAHMFDSFGAAFRAKVEAEVDVPAEWVAAANAAAERIEIDEVEWTSWHGEYSDEGCSPGLPAGVQVMVRRRNGAEHGPYDNGRIEWHHQMVDSDILFFRVVYPGA